MMNIRFQAILSACVCAIHLIPHSAFAQESHADSRPLGPVLEFVGEAMDLGTLTLADLDLFRRDIEFVNRGDQPLILSNVRGCCGTRITAWPQAPIMPGETGLIETQFRLAARPHTVRRTVTVTSNATEPNKVHRITGTVIAGDAPAPAAPTIGPQLLFLEERLDVGALSADQLKDIQARIEFENQGDQPLIIQIARGGAQARVVDWTQNPVLPGERGVIDLELKLQDHPHAFNHHVFVVANTQTRRYTYRINGSVVDP